MIGMMNKNLLAFLYHMLLELDIKEDIVKILLKKSCKASLVADILNCKWQSDARLAEERQEKAVKDLESAAWFKDKFGPLKAPKLNLVFCLKNSSTLMAPHWSRQFMTNIKHPS
jgi:hypothetical protein